MNIAPPLKRDAAIMAVMIIFVLFLAGWSWRKLQHFPQPTPEQVEAAKASAGQLREANEARETAATEKKQAQEAEQAWRNAVCKQEKTCKRYATVRQECAVAGDFKNCIRVKMSEDYSSISQYCTDDGESILGWATNTPSTVECFFRTLGR